jgi:hypothetical protein
MMNFGALLGSINRLKLAGNGLHDATRGYASVLWLQLPVCRIAALLLLMLGCYPHEAAAPAI